MKHLIWTSTPNFDDWKDYLIEEYNEYDEHELYDLMYERNNEYFDDEIVNLNKELGKDIVMYGTLGLWNGKHTAHRFLNKTNLNEILYTVNGDDATWYVEGEEIKCDHIHHDGTNHYTYRVLKPEYNAFDFEEYAYEYSLSKAVNKMTEPLGHYVAEIYGFELEKENEAV